MKPEDAISYIDEVIATQRQTVKKLKEVAEICVNERNSPSPVQYFLKMILVFAQSDDDAMKTIAGIIKHVDLHYIYNWY
ncbi:MAG: hypothetical protein ABI921_01425 [Panacibacter sp.]